MPNTSFGMVRPAESIFGANDIWYQTVNVLDSAQAIKATNPDYNQTAIEDYIETHIINT